MNKTEMQSRLEQTESKTKDVKQNVNTLTELLAKSSPTTLGSDGLPVSACAVQLSRNSC
jgi:hypothetical protein